MTILQQSNEKNLYIRTIFGAPRDPAPAKPKKNMLQAAHGLKRLRSGLRPPSRISGWILRGLRRESKPSQEGGLKPSRIRRPYMGERGYWSKEQNKTKNDPKAASSRERKKQLHVRAEDRTISLQSSLFDPERKKQLHVRG